MLIQISVRREPELMRIKSPHNHGQNRMSFGDKPKEALPTHCLVQNSAADYSLQMD